MSAHVWQNKSSPRIWSSPRPYRLKVTKWREFLLWYSYIWMDQAGKCKSQNVKWGAIRFCQSCSQRAHKPPKLWSSWLLASVRVKAADGRATGWQVVGSPVVIESKSYQWISRIEAAWVPHVDVVVVGVRAEWNERWWTGSQFVSPEAASLRSSKRAGVQWAIPGVPPFRVIKAP